MNAAHRQTPANDKLVNITTVCETLCRSRASIYRDIQREDFPAPIKLGGSSRWRLSDVMAILQGPQQESA